LTFSEEKYMIVVNEDWCKGCNICIERCPVNALEESDKLNRRGVRPPQLKKENECNNCRLCELICPDLAITVTPEEKKKTNKKTLLRPPTGGIG
jgi:2-oxoglutarate ferredoxin oxidoreductase subunit delta